MDINRVIEGLNLHVEEQRKVKNILVNGHLVLQYGIFPTTVFKAYKTYKATLWFIKGEKKFNVVTIEHTSKSLDENAESLRKNAEIVLITEIFNWVGTEGYKQVIDGTFKGYE